MSVHVSGTRWNEARAPLPRRPSNTYQLSPRPALPLFSVVMVVVRVSLLTSLHIVVPLSLSRPTSKSADAPRDGTVGHAPDQRGYARCLIAVVARSHARLLVIAVALLYLTLRIHRRACSSAIAVVARLGRAAIATSASAVAGAARRGEAGTARV